MAKQTINIGSAANDGTGSTLRESFDITNDNFTELYSGTGGLFHKIEGANFTGSLLIGHNTTGTLSNALNNTGIGIGALDALTSGDSNVAIGRTAGGALTSGGHNIAIGHDALRTEDGHGTNIAIGTNALYALNAGADAYNVAIGFDAGKAISTGLENTIIGGKSLDALTTGHLNVAVGYESLSTEDTGSRNTAVGWRALKDLNYDGLGYNAAFGMSAGENISTGIQNTLIGSLAADSLTTGSNNIVIGYDAAASAVDVSNEITLGNSSIANVRIPSDSTLKIGASGDLQLEHLSSNSFIKNTDTGDLYIENQVDDASIIFRCDDGSGGLDTYFSVVGAGNRVQYNKNLRLIDSAIASLGSGDDLQILHDSNHSYIKNYTGDLYIENFADNKDIIFKSDDGSGGVTEYFRLDGGDADGTYTYTRRPDGGVVTFGNEKDLRIWHDPSTNFSYIRNYTNHLSIENSYDDGDIIFKSDDGSGGNTEYFRVDGGATKVIASKNFAFLDSVNIELGDSGDFNMSHNGTDVTLQNFTGNFNIVNKADNADIIFKSDDGSGGVQTYFYLDGGRSDTSNLATRFPDGSIILLGSGTGWNDGAQIYHSGSNFYLNEYVGNIEITCHTTDGDIKFKSDDGSGGETEYFRVDGGDGINYFFKDVKFLDNGKIKFGTGTDLQIYHNATNSLIENSTGDFYISNKHDGGDIIFFCDDGSGGTAQYFRVDGGDVETVFSKRAKFIDNARLNIGSSRDLVLFHNGTDSFIINETGNLKITQGADDADIVFECDDGSEGTTEYFRLDGGLTKVVVNKSFIFEDNIQAQFGSSADLQIYHDSSNSYIKDAGTGNLEIWADGAVIIKSGDGTETKALFDTNGSVDLYYDNSKKFETTSTGINIQSVPEHADNSAASSAGLAVGDVYRTGDLLKIRH